MRKKWIYFLTIAVMGLALTACGKSNDVKETASSEITEQDNTENVTEDYTEESTETEEDTGTTESIEETDTEAGEVQENTEDTAVSILNEVWNAYGEEEKFFAIGGDMNNPVENAPGAYSMEDVETLSTSLAIPAESVALVDEVATLMHAMNANTFTGAAFHLADSASAEAFVMAMMGNMQNTQWICGIPEKVILIQVKEDYIISAFGGSDVIETFKNKVLGVYGENAVVMIEEAIQ